MIPEQATRGAQDGGAEVILVPVNDTHTEERFIQSLKVFAGMNDMAWYLLPSYSHTSYT